MKRVLIVEDNPVWATLLAGYCRDVGGEPVVVRSPQEAMDVLDGDDVSAVILDMLLATETGMALLNEMRGYADLGAIPVIVCTAVDGLELADVAQFGVQDVLDKSIMQPSDVRTALRKVMDE